MSLTTVEFKVLFFIIFNNPSQRKTRTFLSILLAKNLHRLFAPCTSPLCSVNVEKFRVSQIARILRRLFKIQNFPYSLSTFIGSGCTWAFLTELEVNFNFILILLLQENSQYTYKLFFNCFFSTNKC